MRFISKDQIKRLYTVGSINGWKKESIKDVIRFLKGLSDSSEVSASLILEEEYETVIGILSSRYEYVMSKNLDLLEFLKEFTGQLTYTDPEVQEFKISNDTKTLAKQLAILDAVYALEGDDSPEEEDDSEEDNKNAEKEDNPGGIEKVVQLNQGQLKAFNLLNEFTSSNEEEFLLMGSAGTGKSFTIAYWLKEQTKYELSKVLLCAPTHKAKKVLQGFLSHNGIFADVMTIHSALGLKLDEDYEQGKRKLKGYTNPDNNPPIYSYDLCIVDESFMLSQDILSRLQDSFMGRYNSKPLKVIYLGDPLQLEPVGEKESALKKHPMSRFELAEVVRYSGAIAQAVEVAKGCVRVNRRYSPTLLHEYDDPQIVHLKNKFAVQEALLDLFDTDAYREDSSHAKIICFTNEAVKHYNYTVRELLGIVEEGDSFEKPFMPEEELICGSQLKNENNEVIATNGDYFKILEVNQSEVNYYSRFFTEDLNFKCYELKVQNEVGLIFLVNGINEETSNFLDLKISKLKKEALKTKNKSLWREYFQLNDLFPKLQHPHAMTVHKSQGSSYKNIVLISGDLSKCPDASMQGRLFYTGMSRAKEKLFYT